MKTYWGGGGGVEIKVRHSWPRHLAGVSFTLRPVPPRRQSPWCPLDGRLGVLQGQPGHCRRERNLLLLLVIKSQLSSL
jgi:hypothetical protein